MPFFPYYLWQHEEAHSQDSFAVLRYSEHFLDIPRGGCFIKGQKGREIEEVVTFLQQSTRPNQAIYTDATCPLFHFLADRPNPTPFTDFTFYFFSPRNQSLIIKCLDTARVEYIVQWNRLLTGFNFRDCAPLLWDYMNANFAMARRIGRFHILRRKE